MPSGWERRAKKIESRRDNRSFSKPFKKKNVESKKKLEKKKKDYLNILKSEKANQ